MKIKDLKCLLIILILFNFGMIFLSFIQNYYYYSIYTKKSKQVYLESIKNLEISHLFTFNENFATLDYNNDSVTNSSGWGDNSLYLPYQNLISIYNYSGNIDEIKSIEFYKDLVFLADKSLGIKILNISKPWNPRLIMHYGDSYNLTLDITIQGKYAYIADGMDGLEILDLSNPTNPQKINSWSIGQNITNVFLSDNLAFLSVENLGVEILNISNPFSLTRLANWTNYRSPCKVDVKGDHLFVANQNSNLEIIDISNLKNLFKQSQVPISNTSYMIKIINNYLYLANGREGLKLIDIQDISNPSIKTNFYQNGVVKDVLIEENYAFLACDNYGLTGIDLLNPLNLVLKYQWINDIKISLIRKYGDYLFLGCRSEGLKILKFSELIDTNLVSEFSPNINAHDISLDGKIAYVCAIEEDSYKGGLYIINVSDPYKSKILGNFSIPSYNFYDIYIDDEICYAATYEKGLIALNISNPANIQILDSIGGYLLNFSSKLDVYNDIAFVANGFIGLDIYNVSDPLNLEFIDNYPSDGVCYDVKIRNDCAFIAKGYEGIEILNISNINNIQSISRFGEPYNNSQALEFWGNYLLVADRFDGLEIMDISDLSDPQKIGQYNDTYSRTSDVKVIDNLAIISDRNDGIEVINLTNPYQPSEIANFTDIYNQTNACAITSRFIYIADSHDGLQIVQYKEHLFNQYKRISLAQSLVLDYTFATISNATMVISGDVPSDTFLLCFLSNDNGKHWDSVTNNTFHQFSYNGSNLIWKILISTDNDLFTPKIFNIFINYSAINTLPIILQPAELQNLAIWDQPEDFGTFDINLSSYKYDNEFSLEYLNWSIINLSSSLVSVIQDDMNKDIFRFYSIDNIYGSDEFDLYLQDAVGANTFVTISINIYSVNDPPFFIEDNINIHQDQTKNLIRIEYDANDVDNLQSDLNYSIYYGDGNDWNLIIKDYEEEVYSWNTKEIIEGDYFIKLVVSDGANESVWISSERYSIRSNFSLIVSLTLISIIASVGVGLVVYFLIKLKIIERKSKDEII